MSDPGETLADDDRWLQRLSPDTRAFVRDRARLRHYADRALVYAAGDKPDGLYQMVDGEVRLIAYPAVGRQLLTLVARRRHWFGELSVIDGGPRPHDAVCHGPVALWYLPLRDIAVFAREHPEIYGQVALIGCEHQRAALSFIGATLAKSSRARLAGMILGMATPSGPAGRPVVRMSQEDLAGRIGVSRQHLGTLLAELKKRGLVSTAYGRIDVLDRHALAVLAD